MRYWEGYVYSSDWADAVQRKEPKKLRGGSRRKELKAKLDVEAGGLRGSLKKLLKEGACKGGLRGGLKWRLKGKGTI